jgi:hypothetical protein
MSKALEIYPELNNNSDYFNSPCDYNPIVQSFGTVVVKVDEDNYQGDSFVYYVDNDRHGVLIFGWGSCCGCDALQACSSIKDVDDLIESLEKDIKWFTATELYNWLNDDEYQETQYHYHNEPWHTFKKQVVERLTKGIVEEVLIKNG